MLTNADFSIKPLSCHVTSLTHTPAVFVSAPNRANETQTQFAQEFNILDCFIDITVTKPVGPVPSFLYE